MKEREFEIVLVLVDNPSTVLAQYHMPFSSREEALLRTGTLNGDLDKWAVVKWIARPNAKWLGLYCQGDV